MLSGVEIVVGAAIGWLVPRVRRAAGHASEIADEAINAALNRLHSLVASKLAGDPAWHKLTVEAAQDQGVNDRTSKRVELALQDAVEDDRNFAIQLREAVSELQAMQQSDTPDIAAGRDVIQQTGAGTMIVHTGSGNLNSSPQDGEVGE